MNLNTLVPYLSAILGAAIALAGLLRSPRVVSSWAFTAGMLLLAAESLFIGLVGDPALAPADVIKLQQWRLVFLSLLPGIWIVFSLTYARGNARANVARWRFRLAAILLGPLLFALALRPDLLHMVVLGPEWFVRLGLPGLVLHGLIIIGSIYVLMNLENTYRASIGTMRWRIKFMLIGVGTLCIVRIYTSSQFLLFQGLDPLVDSINSGALMLATLLFFRGFARDRRFNLDLYPSQSVLQNSLTALLAGIYLLAVGVFGNLVKLWGGDTTFALKAFFALLSLVLLTLLIQSDRVRLHLRRFVSRHFQRPIYDYRVGWKKFTEGTAACVEQGDLCRVLVRLIADMFQALSVSIWLLDEQKGTFTLAASTSVTDRQGTEASPDISGAEELIAQFRSHPEPVDYETAPAPWAVRLRRLHPAEFNHGGHRVCIPISGRGEILGFITLGDRVAGVSFSLQDFEMLKCACDHAAACLLNIQLSRHLLEAKEFEAFQTMAAFFVHDLKNAASTLNLMLQNLPEHFDDPAFREDALRGMGKTVTHINHLIGRLGLLRHELKIKPVRSSLNALVEQTLAGLEPGPGLELARDLPPLAEFLFDAEQVGKVLTNLVLNAKESITGGGRIHVATKRSGDWAVLTVSDTGCGMSADYLDRFLFRPFQTTKKSGLGIGMFQSKMIVEAHKGRIAVASEPGRGTTFQVFLPFSA